MCDVYREAYFSQNWLNEGLPFSGWFKKTFHEEEINGISICEKVPRTAVGKESDTNMKKFITIDFPEKDATVNNASYCQFLRQ